ncbi:MAG: preprotein translocase subunit SecE [Clostridia bacterium]|nr:preprotein translocase subunit SecE [Clostridia bacterium]
MADTDKDLLKAEKEAEKAAKKAKQERIKQSKPKKDGTIVSRAGKSVKKFWKDFTGTIKKIVWPSRLQVLKSSAVVLVSIIVVGLVIFGFDRGLNALFSLGEDLAEDLGAAYSISETAEDAGEDETDAQTEAASENASEESTEQATEEATEEASEEESETEG